jgi:uncharacterized membrane protein YfcA
VTALLAETLVVGGATGFFSGLLGVGGGFMMIPLLTVLGVPIHTAVGTCLAFVACSNLASMIQHARQGSIDLVVALVMTLPAAVAATVAARFSSLLPPSALHILFSLLLVGILVLYYFSPTPQPLKTLPDISTTASQWYVLQRQRFVGNIRYLYDFDIVKALLSGVATGMLSGFFGIGGGVLLVPLMAVVLHIPLRVTVGTSLAVFILPAMLGALTHWHLGHVDVRLWLPLVLAGIVGSQVGARCVVRMPLEVLKGLFLFLVAAGALVMMVQGLME